MNTSIYQDIAARTAGDIYVGVVGPVRTGKSTFIKRFMETLVIPSIDNVYLKERAKDELPQSGSGKTIMTAEPKFVPEEAVQITVGEDAVMSVRLIDCVGYMVSGASGRFENGEERMVSTPWFDHEISMTEAAEKGTFKVISEHSTIGLVITTDGSVCDIPREDYIEPEARVIRELQSIGKPFVVLLNTTDPGSEQAQAVKASIEEQHGVTCLPVNCLTLGEEDITEILRSVLMEFPVMELGINIPVWTEALPYDMPLVSELIGSIKEATSNMHRIRDVYDVAAALMENDLIDSARITRLDMGTGAVRADVNLPRQLYYDTISQQTGFEIRDDGDLMALLTEMSSMKADYDHIHQALTDVRERGYGVVMPTLEDLSLQEPEIVRQGGKYSVKLKANAPAIHMIMTNVETTVSPAIGGESASEEIINFLLQGFEGDVSRIWESNIFGKSLYDIAGESVTAKVAGMSDSARAKFQETLQRVINEGAGGLICIIL
ncbi:MAG: stage IV sporulation protein A [Oscillospiraceae bacterium]|jgi:stage IV sporulation protein A|nr:stage IV sporulation protein A [Oscillospiraceae bacterium]